MYIFAITRNSGQHCLCAESANTAEVFSQNAKATTICAPKSSKNQTGTVGTVMRMRPLDHHKGDSGQACLNRDAALKPGTPQDAHDSCA